MLPILLQGTQGSYIETAWAEIKAWETEKPCSLNLIADFILAPEEKAVATIIPKNITDEVGNAVGRRLSALASRAKFARSRAERAFVEGIAASYANRSKRGPLSLAEQLESADREARKTWEWYIRCAAADEGTEATAASGFLALSLQVPLLVATLIWQIQAVGCCYGYDPARESPFLLHILEVGTALTLRDKSAFLKKFERAAGKCAAPMPRETLVETIRKTAQTLGVQLTKRKVLQTVPIVAALTGTSFNGMIANDIGQAAFMSYRCRWLAEHVKPEALG